MWLLTHTTPALDGVDVAQRPADVAGPHRGGQTLLDGVGFGDGVGFVGEGLHGGDRPEDLLLHQFVVLLQRR